MLTHCSAKPVRPYRQAYRPSAMESTCVTHQPNDDLQHGMPLQAGEALEVGCQLRHRLIAPEQMHDLAYHLRLHQRERSQAA